MAAPARPTSQTTDGLDAGGAPGPDHHLLTSAEAAAFLTLKESTLRDYSRRGLVPSVKIGRHLRFVEADLIRYLDGLRQQSLKGRLDAGFGRQTW